MMIMTLTLFYSGRFKKSRDLYKYIRLTKTGDIIIMYKTPLTHTDLSMLQAFVDAYLEANNGGDVEQLGKAIGYYIDILTKQKTNLI